MKSDKEIRLLLQSARDALAAGHHTEEGDESIFGVVSALMWVLDKKVDPRLEPDMQKSIDTLTDIARTERRKQAANAWRNASRFN